MLDPTTESHCCPNPSPAFPLPAASVIPFHETLCSSFSLSLSFTVSLTLSLSLSLFLCFSVSLSLTNIRRFHRPSPFYVSLFPLPPLVLSLLPYFIPLFSPPTLPLSLAPSPLFPFHLSSVRHANALSLSLSAPLSISLSPSPGCLGNYYGTPKPPRQPLIGALILGDAGPQPSTPKRTRSYHDMQHARVAPADHDDDDLASEMNNSFTGTREGV